MLFLCGRGARWGGMHQFSLRLSAALGVSCPYPQRLCEVSRVPCVTLLSGVCGCPELQVRAPSSVLWLGYSSLHVPVSCVTCEFPALPQQKSQVCVAGFGQQIAADFKCGVGLGLSCSPNMSWVSIVCSALWDICLCSCVQFVG